MASENNTTEILMRCHDAGLTDIAQFIESFLATQNEKVAKLEKERNDALALLHRVKPYLAIVEYFCTHTLKANGVHGKSIECMLRTIESQVDLHQQDDYKDLRYMYGFDDD